MQHDVHVIRYMQHDVHVIRFMQHDVHVIRYMQHDVHVIRYMSSKQCVVGSNPTGAALFSFRRKKSCLG